MGLPGLSWFFKPIRTGDPLDFASDKQTRQRDVICGVLRIATRPQAHGEQKTYILL